VPSVAELTPHLRPLYSSNGNETIRLQQRLLEIGFWVAQANGRYDLSTRQAVMAFQKYLGLNRSGRVDGATANALSAAMPKAQALTTTGDGIEVDKNRQILFVIHEGATQFVLNASTGSGQYFLEQNQKDPTRWENGRAITPSGRYVIQRQKPEGWWDGDLGKIYRPKYFDGGRAVHGLGSVPAYPASHGCVRVSIPAMDMLWTLPYLKKNTPVWVYGDDIAPRNKPIPIPPPTSSTSSTTPSSSSSTTSTTAAPVN
jgi:peptidoglycan hydrolase-like protein with peptidoglycan-binding domain